MIDDLTDQSKKKMARMTRMTHTHRWPADLVDPAIPLNATYDSLKVTLSNFQHISRTI